MRAECFDKALNTRGLRTHFAAEIERIANQDRSALGFAQESKERFGVVPAVVASGCAMVGQQGLRGQSQAVGDRDPDAALAYIQCSDPRQVQVSRISLLHHAVIVMGFRGCFGTGPGMDRVEPLYLGVTASKVRRLPVRLKEAQWPRIRQQERVNSLKRLFLLVLLILVVAAAYLFLAPAGSNKEKFVDIASGTGSGGIGEDLEQAGVIRSRYAFLVLRLIKGGTLQAGEYRFDHAATISEVYDRLRKGDVYYRVLTIPEGYNIFDVAGAVEAAGLDTKDNFLAAARRDVKLVADIDPHAQTLEGYLYPETYHFQRRENADQMAAAMVKQFRAHSQQIGLTANFHAVVTMASLVEKETPNPTDRPLVASVLNNRLTAKMPLMTDPTVIYAAMLQHRYRGAIYQSDLQAESEYNTYKHTGLPPGPICNPGVAALNAAIHPASSKYMYFVADPAAQGHSRFAATLEEHNRNVEAYRRAQRADAH